jgi:hypothetical protein
MFVGGTRRIYMRPFIVARVQKEIHELETDGFLKMILGFSGNLAHPLFLSFIFSGTKNNVHEHER